MKYKHIESISVATLGQYIISNQLNQDIRIVFYDTNNPKLMAIATPYNIGEVDAQFDPSDNRIFRIYEPDLPKSIA